MNLKGTSSCDFTLVRVGPVRTSLVRANYPVGPPRYFLELQWDDGPSTWIELTERGPALAKGELYVSPRLIESLRQKVEPWTPVVFDGGIKEEGNGGP